MSEVHTTVINKSYATIHITITLPFGLFTSFKLKYGILLLMFTYESTCDRVIVQVGTKHILIVPHNIN